jgi:hypothetical protein
MRDVRWAKAKVAALLAPLVTPEPEPELTEEEFMAMMDEAFRLEMERLHAQNQKRP